MGGLMVHEEVPSLFIPPLCKQPIQEKINTLYDKVCYLRLHLQIQVTPKLASNFNLTSGDVHKTEVQSFQSRIFYGLLLGFQGNVLAVYDSTDKYKSHCIDMNNNHKNMNFFFNQKVKRHGQINLMMNKGKSEIILQY